MDYLSFVLRAVSIKLEKSVSTDGKETCDFIKQPITRRGQNGVGYDLKGRWYLLKNQIHLYEVPSFYGKTGLRKIPFVVK